MLPSKKSIRKMRTQPFPGWVLSFVKNADDYCGSLIMFSIKIIEHKKYLVGKGINVGYLTDCVKAVNDDNVSLSIKNALNPIIIKGKTETETVLVPMRISN